MKEQYKQKNTPESSQRNLLTDRTVQTLYALGVVGLIISALLIFFDRTVVNQYGIPSADTLDELLDKAAHEEKYSIIKFEAPYCFPCGNSSPEQNKAHFQSLAEKCFMYEVNALDLGGEGPSMAQHYGVSSLPTWLVLDENGQEVRRWEASGLPPVESLLVTSSSSAPLASAGTSTQHYHDDESEKFTLMWHDHLSYWESIRMAEQLESLVLESVWTQPDSLGNWTVCSGTYTDIIQARNSRMFHTEWREQPLRIVALKESGWALPSN